MKITRNFGAGNYTFELTEQEIEQAYREQERMYHGLDVEGEYENQYNKECPYDKETAKKIGERAIELLDKTDGYWDYYWEAVDKAIEEHEKEK